MRTGLVVDAACDLPAEFIESHPVEILPIGVHVGDRQEHDTRDAVQTRRFYERYANEHDLSAETFALPSEDIEAFFLDRLVLEYDRVLVLTLMSARSPVHDNATQASFRILNEYHERRRAEGVGGNFQLRVLDTETLFCGQAALAGAAMERIVARTSFGAIRPELEALKDHVHAYCVPQDLFFIRKRARQKGDRSISWLGYNIGSTLDVKPIVRGWRNETRSVAKVRGFTEAVERVLRLAIDELERGLRASDVWVSYAGDPDWLHELARWHDLQRLAEASGVRVRLALSSVTMAINVGPGAFAIGFIGNRRPDEAGP